MAADKTASTNPQPDVEAVVDRITAANRKAGNDYLDLVEKTVDQVTALQLDAAGATKLPGVAELVESQVGVTRAITGTYVKTARELLNA